MKYTNFFLHKIPHRRLHAHLLTAGENAPHQVPRSNGRGSHWEHWHHCKLRLAEASWRYCVVEVNCLFCIWSTSPVSTSPIKWNELKWHDVLKWIVLFWNTNATFEAAMWSSKNTWTTHCSWKHANKITSYRGGHSIASAAPNCDARQCLSNKPCWDTWVFFLAPFFLPDPCDSFQWKLLCQWPFLSPWAKPQV